MGLSKGLHGDPPRTSLCPVRMERSAYGHCLLQSRDPPGRVAEEPDGRAGEGQGEPVVGRRVDRYAALAATQRHNVERNSGALVPCNVSSGAKLVTSLPHSGGSWPSRLSENAANPSGTNEARTNSAPVTSRPAIISHPPTAATANANAPRASLRLTPKPARRRKKDQLNAAANPLIRSTITNFATRDSRNVTPYWSSSRAPQTSRIKPRDNQGPNRSRVCIGDLAD